jgi:hypothetical protein
MALLPDPKLVGPNKDDDYIFACKDLEKKLFLEQLWEKYERFADKNFSRKISNNFHCHFWEMYLTCTLLENGMSLSPKKKWIGPDIRIKDSESSSIWVEAVTCTQGLGNDKILPIESSDPIVWFRVPEEKIVLRYTAAIDEKFKKFNLYKNKIISESDPYIIAVNGNKVPYNSDDDGDIPYFVQAVFPYGLPRIQFDSDDPKKFTYGFNYRDHIMKISGSSVPTNIFLKDEYQGISGILFSNICIDKISGKMGNDFIFIHNNRAHNKVPEGWLRVGREYRLNENSLEWRIWSK